MTKHVKQGSFRQGQFVTKRVNLAGMAETTKGNTLRLYLRDAELKQLAELSDVLEISQTEVMSRIMTAGIRAIVENENRMPLPLKFAIPGQGTNRYDLNETAPPHKSRK